MMGFSKYVPSVSRFRRGAAFWQVFLETHLGDEVSIVCMTCLADLSPNAVATVLMDCRVE